MKFDWRNYLDLAKALCEQKIPGASAEARHRASISRAYYAILNQSRRYIELAALESVPQNSDVHSFVRIWFLKAKLQPVGREISDKLLALSRERGRADYRDEYRDSAKQAEYCIIEAEEAFKLLARLPKRM